MQDFVYSVLIPMQVLYIAWLTTALRCPFDTLRHATPAWKGITGVSFSSSLMESDRRRPIMTLFVPLVVCLLESVQISLL